MIYTYTRTFKVTAFQYIDEDTLLPQWFKKSLICENGDEPWWHDPYFSKSKKRLGEKLYSKLYWHQLSGLSHVRTNDWVVMIGKRIYPVKNEIFRRDYKIDKGR